MPSAEHVARDTIAAVATPSGRGGIGIVRTSGPAVLRIAQVLLGQLPAPRHAALMEFSAGIEGLRMALVELRALTEAQLDFPEEELDEFHRGASAQRLAAVRTALDQVLDQSRQGSLLRSGIHVVLAGSPNVGKSSLLNRLAGEERAIVTPIPGTTRDALREPIHIEGVAVILVDTAGLRESNDELEKLGMARTRAELERADIVLAVHDATA